MIRIMAWRGAPKPARRRGVRIAVLVVLAIVAQAVGAPGSHAQSPARQRTVAEREAGIALALAEVFGVQSGTNRQPPPYMEEPGAAAEHVLAGGWVRLDPEARAEVDSLIARANEAVRREPARRREVVRNTAIMTSGVAREADAAGVVTRPAARRGWRRICPLYPFCD